MKEFLQDLVAHTHSLGFLPLVKIIASDEETTIAAMADDRSVILDAKTKSPVSGVAGQFGMPNLNKLDLHLKCPEYKTDANIKVVVSQRNGADVPTGLHFENKAGDYQNDYRFMSAEIINEKMKTVKFKGAKWAVEFTPSVASIQRLKFQAAANNEESVFQVRTDEEDNLVFSFGDAATHAGSFVFQPNVGGKLKQVWAWPVAQVLSLLNLDGDITMRIADAGALQFTVTSDIAEYTYTLPAMTK